MHGEGRVKQKQSFPLSQVKRQLNCCIINPFILDICVCVCVSSVSDPIYFSCFSQLLQSFAARLKMHHPKPKTGLRHIIQQNLVCIINLQRDLPKADIP